MRYSLISLKIKSKMKTVELSFHIQNVPCSEEIMAAGNQQLT